ncbi:LysM-like peptidoglycan-binding domain-containing protein [Superficieibacter sp. HKU1]|uniref:LysM-like peptidoglycan-binding domain-containing protein n=1 Tax=Superficieibacter sp. HKU1 TaxID=3031919 RepID=UPI0023E2EC6D|nr:LysM-like peptidoglycan-binding domain-containing protein [Superficieibacter sp. HKU1]WES67944.1 LysM-like peptidoglycan-binding domain-containing protein [Superficieibacter sp. HKU1]
MPGRVDVKSTLARIWHAPDHFRLMDPLPPMHRRGIIIAAALVVIGFLLPSGDDNTTQPVVRDAQLDIQPPPQQQQPMQTQLVTPSNDPGAVAPVEPEPVQEQPDDQAQVQTPPPEQQQPTPGIDQQWRAYRVESGKTLAQVFRDHNLPATDVYAMAKVEGAGKPLSTLQSGQMVKIRQNASGVVTGLTIDMGNGQQALFTRQPDGNFIRAQ